MKRLLLFPLLFLIGNISLSLAEPTLYGSLKYDLSYQSSDYHSPFSYGNDGKNYRKRGTSMQHRDSYIGIKGSEDLGNGNELIYKVEWGFEAPRDKKRHHSTFRGNNRESYIGFSGDWGTLLIGRIKNPFKETIQGGSVVDEFNLNQY